MKAKELMVDDWLRHENGTPMQVTRIDYTQSGGHFACGTPHCWEYNNKFEPIPLTAEFFDRNGWHRIEREKYGKLYVLYDDYYEMSAHEFNDGMWRVEYDCVEMGGIPAECVNIGWVHEFQHFLSHCAVNMEINLED